MINSVSVQIQRAINDAISSQVLSQIQNDITSGSGPVTQKGWNVPVTRQEYIAEDYRNDKIRSNSRRVAVNRSNFSGRKDRGRTF